MGSKVQFWGPISLCLCAFLGLDARGTAKSSALSLLFQGKRPPNTASSPPAIPFLPGTVLEHSARHFRGMWAFSFSCSSKRARLQCFLKLRRVTIRGAQPSARLSEEICLSEGSAGVSERAPRGRSAGSLRGSAGVRGIFRGFRG